MGEADEVAGGSLLAPLRGPEVLGLLSMVRLGRVAYSHRALPAVQIVSHVIDQGDIVFRCHGKPPVIPPGQGGPVVLAYEADDVDPEKFTGWRVTVTGLAKLVRRPQEVARLNGLLPPWPVNGGGCRLVRLHPGMLSGYRFLGPGKRGQPCSSATS
ncbi:MAG TPA: pyridoxamine 5'-phosphate oxidase family protein [Streptosporangiaceae bacterium]|jgi:hypothetical protein